MTSTRPLYAVSREGSRATSGVRGMSGMTVHHASQRILIVDDDPSSRELLDGLFEVNGFQVTHTDSVLGASELIARDRPTVILLDLTLPYRSGASWLAQLKANPV